MSGSAEHTELNILPSLLEHNTYSFDKNKVTKFLRLYQEIQRLFLIKNQLTNTF